LISETSYDDGPLSMSMSECIYIRHCKLERWIRSTGDQWS